MQHRSNICYPKCENFLFSSELDSRYLGKFIIPNIGNLYGELVLDRGQITLNLIKCTKESDVILNNYESILGSNDTDSFLLKNLVLFLNSNNPKGSYYSFVAESIIIGNDIHSECKYNKINLHSKDLCPWMYSGGVGSKRSFNVTENNNIINLNFTWENISNSKISTPYPDEQYIPKIEIEYNSNTDILTIENFVHLLRVILSILVGQPIIFNKIQFGNDTYYSKKLSDPYSTHFKKTLDSTEIAYPLYDCNFLNTHTPKLPDEFFSNFFKLEEYVVESIERYFFQFAYNFPSSASFITYISSIESLTNLKPASSLLKEPSEKKIKEIIKLEIDDNNISSRIIGEISRTFRSKPLYNRLNELFDQNIDQKLLKNILVDKEKCLRLIVDQRNALAHGFSIKSDDKNRKIDYSLLHLLNNMMTIIYPAIILNLCNISSEDIQNSFLKNQQYTLKIRNSFQRIKKYFKN